MKNENFRNLVFYEIYPTSFYDSDGDGIGDIKGIEEKLSYIKETGFNAVWLNPFYDSPFMDGGYDVRNFFMVDKRFGTNGDFRHLCDKAHEMGLKTIVDLVPGHASEENPDFLKSAEPFRNENYDLFIWSDSAWKQDSKYKLIAGRYNRDGCYMVNFFSTQPAFNYGFNNITDPSWQISYTDERTFMARDYMIKVMKFWCNLGADGFRVDMADSLVKNDDELCTATGVVWHYIFDEVRKEYPDIYIVSESGHAERAFRNGFDADFMLDFYEFSYLKTFIRSGKDSVLLSGKNIDKFVSEINHTYETAERLGGYIANISGNHDEMRIATLAKEKLKTFYLFILSLPGTPFIYYGDEIGMEYTDNLPSKDGGYTRTGSRTPMQWDDSFNMGFSSSLNLYLPVGKGNRTNLASLKENSNSVYHFIKDLIEFRKNSKSLLSDYVKAENKNGIVYIDRGDLLLVMNFKNEMVELDKKVLFTSGFGNELKPYEAALIIK